MTNKYELLYSEIECINRAWDYSGMLDALEYIRENREEYYGTAVYRQFCQFCAEMAELFQPV